MRKRDKYDWVDDPWAGDNDVYFQPPPRRWLVYGLSITLLIVPLFAIQNQGERPVEAFEPLPTIAEPAGMVVEATSTPQIIAGIIYGYSSTPDQTDDSPFITASQQRVREGIIANNCLPFGTEVAIDGTVYEVQDRMNARYGCEVFDIWFPTRQAAKNWGIRRRVITVL